MARNYLITKGFELVYQLPTISLYHRTTEPVFMEGLQEEEQYRDPSGRVLSAEEMEATRKALWLKWKQGENDEQETKMLNALTSTLRGYRGTFKPHGADR